MMAAMPSEPTVSVAAAAAALLGRRDAARIAGLDERTFGSLIAGAEPSAEVAGRLALAVDLVERVVGSGDAQLAHAWLHAPDPVLGESPLARLARAASDAGELRASAERFVG